MAQLLNAPRRWKQFIKSSVSDLQDPVFLTFDLDFFPDNDRTMPDQTNLYWNSLWADSNNEGGMSMFKEAEPAAVDWLMQYGSPWTEKAGNSLVAAKTILLQLQDSPWYFQSIAGIDSLWKAASRVKDGDKKAEITINCFDSIEQPLMQFAQNYRTAIFDQDRLSYTLPDNLRTFDMILTLYEIRDIRDDKNRLVKGLYQVRYRMKRCEFDFDLFLSGPTMTEVKAYTIDQPFNTSFKIKCEWVIETAAHTVIEDYQSLGIFSSLANSLEGRAQRFFSTLESVPSRLIGDLSNKLQTGLENTVSQNVYNRSNEVLSTNRILGRRSPVGPSAGSAINDDVYPGSNTKPQINNNDLGDVYP